MSDFQIKHFHTLLSFLPKTCTFVDASFQKLTSSGENYGSVLFSADIVVKDDENQEQHIYSVIKKPPSNKLIREMFNTNRTFPCEVAFYQTIAPCLQQFQKEQNIANLFRSFPDFYSARHGPDAVLLMKNIKKEGFQILDRTTGFNLPTARIILEKIAELHATVIALKVKKPEIFKSSFMPFFKGYDTFVMDEENNDKMIAAALSAVTDEEICEKYLEKLRSIMLESSKIIPKKNRVEEESPFFSLVHSDLWTNNIMVKIQEEETEVKFVDFQLYEYASLTRDVIFFIYSSVDTDTLKNNCDDLFLHYYNYFCNFLSTMDCDAFFSFDEFLEEIKLMVKKYEFFHIMTMLPPIYAAAKDTKDVEQLEMDSLIFYGIEVTQKHRDKANFIVRDFLRRQWLF